MRPSFLLVLVLPLACASQPPPPRVTLSSPEPSSAPGTAVEDDRFFGSPSVAIPPIDARVCAVKDDASPALVLLSVGRACGVEKGFEFSIYRGTAFIGKIVVEKVLEDSSGCRVLFTREGEAIQAGDMAATRLQ